MDSTKDIAALYNSDSAYYLPPGDLNNLLSKLERQKQTINLLITALDETSDGLMDCASRCEDAGDLLDIARKITKTLVTVATSNYTYTPKDKEVNS